MIILNAEPLITKRTGHANTRNNASNNVGTSQHDYSGQETAERHVAIYVKF